MNIMNRFFKIGVTLLFVFVFQIIALSQDVKQIEYGVQEAPSSRIEQLGTLQIESASFKVFQMNLERLQNELIGVAKTTDSKSGFIAQIELPHPDGSTHLYNVKLNTTMSDGLQEKFPEIRSYDAYGVHLPAKAKIDITPSGFHAMIMQPSVNTIFIDPAVKNNTAYYMVYNRNSVTSKQKGDWECLVTPDDTKGTLNATDVLEKNYLTCELRTFRLALAASVEYTDFHGGTVANAIAAQVTTMNRVNGIYERDLGVTLSIVPNNDLLVYEGDPIADPYSNGDAFAMLGENQSNVDAVIGAANYDIGHVFGTNSGGVAGLGVICINGSKGYGVTGSEAPINDPFNVDYVAHEMGHQFGGNHTQNNNCNRNNATAMEPGSASTILGYAGICNPNIQGNSDDHFHGISLQEMGARITSTSCAAITPLTNSPPIIEATNGNVHIPASTPFALTAFATDTDGDVLSYCWEQMDNEISPQPPKEESLGGPNFRSYSPVNDSTRYFPKLISLVSNNPFVFRWEVIPTVSRTMNFRVTVRDQPLNVAGCPDFTDVTVSTVEEAGPFVVLYPSEEGIEWKGFDDEIVTWDVAKTDEDPINCDSVDIFLSINGGASYPILVASGVPNTGSAEIVVPNFPTNLARIMVMSASGTFFNISDNNFKIIELTDDFVLDVSPAIVNVCTPENAEYTIQIDTLDGFDDPVSLSVSGLPDGAEASFSNTTVAPAGSSILTISNTDEIAPGYYELTIKATSSTGTKTKEVELVIRSGTPATVVQLTEAESSGDGPIVWEASPEVDVVYDIQIATDAEFTTIIDEASGLSTTSYTSSALSPSSTYFWRIRAVTVCGQSQWTAPYFDSEKVIIYPNPTIGNFTISWVGKADKIEVSDAVGKLVERIAVKNITTTDIDLGKYRAGVYHISISSNTGNYFYEVIKL